MQEALTGIYTALLLSIVASRFPDSGKNQPFTAENPSYPCLAIPRGGPYKV